MGQYSLGMTVGPNISWQQFEDNTFKSFHQSNSGVGYQISGIMLFRAKNNIGLSLEAGFEKKSSKVQSDANDYQERKIRLNYLDFPILFRYFIPLKGADLYLGVGPELNYWLGGSGSFEVYDPNRDLVNTYDYQIHFGDDKTTPDYMNVSDPNRLQISIVFAVGYLQELNNSNLLGVDLRFSLGNTYLGEFDGGQIPQLGLTDNLEATINVINLSLVYLYELGSKREGR